MRALLVYHSMFGNTRSIAESLGRGLEEAGIEVVLLGTQEVVVSEVAGYDFLAVGGPTHMIGLSKGMKEFLQKIKHIDLKGKAGFAFDTRAQSRMNKRRWWFLENSAARRIQGKLRRMKLRIIRERESAIVSGREGPLRQNEEERFVEIGRELGSILQDL
ncbi:MAG: flavodoxin domain-containing protein [Candidatus Thorarchaeota archaeon]|nr:MAG: flavodoxin domain-containing protein [Candidatus Thorarchaeota archaeon]